MFSYYLVHDAGEAAIPLVFLMLGVEVRKGFTGKTTHGRHVMWSATVMRMLVAPALSMMTIWIAEHFIRQHDSHLDELILLVLGLEGISPTAINLTTIAGLWNYAADDVAATLTIQYLGAVLTQGLWTAVLAEIL